MQNPKGVPVIFRQSQRSINKGILFRLEALESAPGAPPPPVPTEALLADIEVHLETRLAPLKHSLLELERRLKDTNVAVAEGIERTDRTERRIASTVARARKELRESGYDHPGVAAEDHELRKVDGDGSHGTEVLNLPEAVEADADNPSSIRGVPASTLRRVRGIG